MKLGDLVLLKSGGPIMTVTVYPDRCGGPKDFVPVVWIDVNNVVYREMFHATALKLVKTS